MNVNEWMQKEVVRVTPTTSVTDVARLMTQRMTRHVLVIEDGGRLVGVISAADLIAKHAQVHMPTYFSLLGYSVPLSSARDEREIEKALAAVASDLMSTNIASTSPSADIDSAASLMMDNSVSFLPVLEGTSVVGTIDEMDIVRLLVVEEGS